MPPLWPVAVGAYFPLHALANAQALLQRSWPQSLSALFVQQIEEQAEERRLAKEIPALTEIDSEVSRSVRQQYEENPYPRWVKVALPQQHTLLASRKPGQIADVLIAGCGTGAFRHHVCATAPEARMLAVDLSLASLSYAKRMANKLGFTQYRIRPSRHHQGGRDRPQRSISSTCPACCTISPIRGRAGVRYCRCCDRAA